MQTIVKKDTNISLYYLEDGKTVDIGSSQITISDGGTPELIIADCNSSNATLHTGVDAKSDYWVWKYKHDGSSWSANADFKGINMFLTNLRDSILVSINFYGLGVGYDIADEYLFQTDTTKLWGSHSNLVQIISGVGLIPSFFIFTFLSSLLFKSVNYFLKENDNKEILLFLFISIVGMLVTGILRTYALNYYFILIIAITYVLLNNKSTKS